MVEISNEATEIEKLYEWRTPQSLDKARDYEGISNAIKGRIKAKRLAAQLIPRFFEFFPDIRHTDVDAHFDLCEADQLRIRVQAIRGLPLFWKDMPEYLSKTSGCPAN